MIRSFLLFFFSIGVMVGHSQSPADWWYFGENAGIHFTASGPVADTNGQLITAEGCASISDAMGNLLFYTDGVTVYDAQHGIMPNGTGLMGHNSCTQSAIIVKRPNSNIEYYIFTVGVGTFGMHYSKVDMTLNGGLGDVVNSEKNIALVSPAPEKMACIPRSDGGFWVFTFKLPGDTVYAYSVTSAGVNLTPVTSNSGIALATSNFFGYMKPNQAGTKVAAVHYLLPNVYLHDFDANTGMFSPDIELTSSLDGFCGIEFSPNGELLYVQRTSSSDIAQFDLTLGTAAAISASETIIGSGTHGGGALQLGPDGKIYGARNGRSVLAVINNPNQQGSACNYVDSAVALLGPISRLGLPNFIQSLFTAAFDVKQFCANEFTQFSMDSSGVDSVVWNFGDPNSGTLNTSTLFNPSHLFTDTGSFTVSMVAHQDTLVDTALRFVYIYPRQTIDLGNDTVLCTNDSVVFSAMQTRASFLWQDSTTNDSMWVDADTTVWVTVFGVCDTVSDTVNVVYADSIQFDLGPDTLFCDGAGYTLDANITTAGATFEWNTGDTIDSITVTVSDEYTLSATNACGTVIDSVNVTFKPVPLDSFLPSDTLNCFDNAIVLVRPDQDSVTYIWSDSTSKKNYTVDTTETVWLAAFNECGISVDTIDIIFNGEILSELGEDTNICEGDSILLIATHPGASYVWNTGDTTDTAWTDQVESFNYVVTVTYKACQTIESKRVDMDDFFCEPIDCVLEYPNIFSPNGDGINDIFRAWSDCEIYSYTLTVYNRWGLLVHHDTHEAFGWDGNIHGQPAPEGVYYFLIDFIDQVVVDEDRNIYQGSMTIVR